MKNINYDLVKLLEMVSHVRWNLKKHYISDAKEAKCHSQPLLEKMDKDLEKYEESLMKELQMRVDAKIFD